ncbi:MAG: oligosaccharide flippase family protein [Candidatus Eremiobacteraeota bacterium]|nr:oligosaccharide flippase family protein [Candidatus Eremiobacteraeota bacterium]
MFHFYAARNDRPAEQVAGTRARAFVLSGNLTAASAAMVKSSISRDTISTFLFSAAAAVFAILTGIFLAKTVGPYGKGVFSGVQVLQAGICSATSGAGAAITYLLTNQRVSVQALVRPLAALLLGATSIAWLFLAGWGLFNGFNVTLLTAGAVIPASIIISWRAYFYMGAGRIRTLNYQALATAIAVLLAVAVAIVALHAGVGGALVAWATCLYAAAAVVIGDVLRTSDWRQERWSAEHLRSLLRFGSRSGLSGLLGFLNYRIDSVVLIAYLGAAGFGVYSVAVSAAELLFMIPRAISMAASKEIGERDLVMSGELTAKSVRLATASTCGLALIIGLVAPTFIYHVYGPKFYPAALPLRVLLLGVVAFAAGGIFSSFFGYQFGRPAVLLYVMAATIVLQMLLAIVLVPRYGLLGAATASTVTYVLVGTMQALYFCKLTHLPVTSLWLLRKTDLDVLRLRSRST